MKAEKATKDELRDAALKPLPVIQKMQPKGRKKHKLHPRLEWVLVRKTSLDEEVSEAGIILNRDNVKLHQGEIVECGVTAAACGLNPGDRILYTAFGMDLDDVELLTGDKNLFMIRHEEVYSTIEGTDEEIFTLEAKPSAQPVQA